MKPLKVAVIGVGYWGPNLVRNLASTPGIEVSWVCDLEQQRLDDVARRVRVTQTTTRYQDVLDDASTDAVVLATPVNSHKKLGEMALNAGKHLWVEKPLAGSLEDARTLVELAKKKDRRLLVDHTFIYTPAVRKIRELISSGEMGEVLYFDSVRVNLGLFQSDTNVLWDLGPHDLSIAQYVLGRRPKEVSAVGIRHVAGAQENMAYLTLRYEDNILAHFHFNWLAPVKLRLTLIGGTRRMLVFDDIEPVEKLKLYDKGVDTRTDPSAVEDRRRTLISYRTGDMWSPRLDQTEALAFAARDFASSIRENRPPISDGEIGLDVVKTLAAAQRSLEQNGAFITV
jgi:predicted dehydrogenase